MNLIRDAFTLPKVKPNKVLNDLTSGKYDQLRLKDLSFNLKTKFERKEYKPTISFDNKMFEEKTASNGKKVSLAHINKELYENFIKTGKIKKPETYTCLWCRRKKEDEVPVRIPFKLERKENIICVHVLYTTCSYNCALAEIMNRLLRFPHDQNYEEAKLLIKLLFSLEYPGKKLEAAADYLLLDINGGPVSEDVYFSGFYSFKEDKSYVYVPADKLYFFLKSEQTQFI